MGFPGSVTVELAVEIEGGAGAGVAAWPTEVEQQPGFHCVTGHAGTIPSPRPLFAGAGVALVGGAPPLVLELGR